jgi:hypothetical protein
VRDNRIYPLEFKKTASPSKKDVLSFKTLDKLRMAVGHGGLICLVDHSLPLSESVDTIPVAAL